MASFFYKYKICYTIFSLLFHRKTNYNPVINCKLCKFVKKVIIYFNEYLK